MTLKEALDSGYCSLEDDIDFDDTPQGEKIACLKLEIERLKEQLNDEIDEELKQSEIMVKKQKEIERLNNIIEEYKNANEYHQNIIHELETMKQPNQLHSENVKLRAENNRLNNIINELEKYIGIKMNSFGICNASDIYLKLKELKGSESNE